MHESSRNYFHFASIQITGNMNIYSYSFTFFLGVISFTYIMASDRGQQLSSSYEQWEALSVRLRKDQEKHWHEAPPDDQAEWDTWLSQNPGMEHLIPYDYQNKYEVVTTLRDIPPEFRFAHPVIPSISTTPIETKTPSKPPSPVSELRYSCPVRDCPHRFRLANDLRRHFFTHDEELAQSPIYPYSCFICEASFSQKELVFTHLRNTHNDVLDMRRMTDEELECYVVSHTKLRDSVIQQPNSL